MITKHLNLKWHNIIKLEKNKSMKAVFNYIVFLWACSYLSLKISAIWLADEKVLNQLVAFRYHSNKDKWLYSWNYSYQMNETFTSLSICADDW